MERYFNIAQWVSSIVVNSNECLLTRLQEMSLDYHFSVEQEVGSSTYSFFGFNGMLPQILVQNLLSFLKSNMAF
jgi:hypothetical protein